MSPAFARGIHWWPVNTLHKRPVTRKRFPFDDVIMVVRSMAQAWQLKFGSLRLFHSLNAHHRLPNYLHGLEIISQVMKPCKICPIPFWQSCSHQTIAPFQYKDHLIGYGYSHYTDKMVAKPVNGTGRFVIDRRDMEFVEGYPGGTPHFVTDRRHLYC